MASSLAQSAEPESCLEGDVPSGLDIGLHQDISAANERSDSQDTTLVAETEEEDEYDESQPLLSSNRKNSRERSKSTRRKLKWYQKASPYWFFPATLMTSLSLGMIIAPKIQIYTELICRSIDPSQSGVTLPFPGIDSLNPSPITILLPVTIPPRLLNTTESLAQPRSMEDPQLFLIKQLDVDVMGRRNDTWFGQCQSSPAVQKDLARLATILTTIMGVLSALTTGYWGSLSDRVGRKTIIALALLGTIVLDIVFLIVVHFHDIVGYQFLLVGPVVDGLLGGMSTMSAATNAYVTDSTDSGSRAKVFSVLAALLFSGIAIGPGLGAIVIEATGVVLLPFYLALAFHVFFLFGTLLCVPESLSASRQEGARVRYVADAVARREREKAEDIAAVDAGTVVRLRITGTRVLTRFFGFLHPLGLLLPKQRTGEETVEELPILESRGGVKVGTDWELSKIGIAYALYVTCVSIMQVKIIYSGYKFSWGLVENGYYLSFIGTCRVIVLILLVPLGIKLFKEPAPLPLIPRPDGHVAGDVEIDGEIVSEDQKEWNLEAKYLTVVHDSHFDLLLARVSIALEACAYLILSANARGSPVQFIVASGISSLGGAASPALSSLALSLTSPRDTGRLFASLGVLSCVFAQILGPLFFLVVFNSSIATYPEMVFLAGEALFLSALGVLALVRLRKVEQRGRAEERAIGIETGSGGRRKRGRSLTKKASTNFSGVVLR